MPIAWLEKKNGRIYSVIEWNDGTRKPGPRFGEDKPENRRLAKQWLTNKRLELAGSSAGLPPMKKNLETLIEEIEAEHGDNKSSKTYAWYRDSWKALKTSQHPKSSDDITPGMLKAWKIDMNKKKLSLTSINTYMRGMRSLLNRAGIKGKFEGVEIPKPKARDRKYRYLTNEERVIILTACLMEDLKRIVDLSLHTGTRQGEIAASRHEHRKVKGALFIPGKEDPDRSVGIKAHAEGLLGQKKTGPIFPGWNEQRIKRAFGRAVKRSGLGTVRFHDLRHTWASNFMANGGKLPDLMIQGGWQDLASVRVYLHSAQQNLAEENTVDYTIRGESSEAGNSGQIRGGLTKNLPFASANGSGVLKEQNGDFVEK